MEATHIKAQRMPLTVLRIQLGLAHLPDTQHEQEESLKRITGPHCIRLLWLGFRLRDRFAGWLGLASAHRPWKELSGGTGSND